MKTRFGFVSNSSSSSFIISEEKFPSVASLAKYMINKQIEEERYSENDKEYIQRKKNLIKKLNKIDPNQPITFTSCNYDTYIKKIGDRYLVSTCNNTRWDLYSTNLSDLAIEKLKELLKKYKEGSVDYNTISDILETNGRDEFYHFDNDYYFLEYDVIGAETRSFKWCEKCNSTYWNTANWGEICLNCSPLPKRFEKLQMINNNIKDE